MVHIPVNKRENILQLLTRLLVIEACAKYTLPVGSCNFGTISVKKYSSLIALHPV